MNRGEVRYAEAGEGLGRRPVVILTADELVPVLSELTCAPVTTRIRDLPTRVAIGPDEGLREPSEVVCEAMTAIRKRDIDTAPMGAPRAAKIIELDRAIVRALGIRRANLPRP